ncbi:hypothetical protein PVAND_003888 [Polypedilum vanderplanki]|uniref:C2H2-type domain-containing protein n=1 Tax=Polypedilum vanderplanki TaxID=319348 RepID=A0A9J6BVD6_POLVA|nr:hypothetical protein PVAND_003888 [Polypedilum vanderplanki]
MEILKNITDFCSLCLKTHFEVNLIDTTRNSLLIDNKYYEFSFIFNDLLNTSFEDGCICELCKDSLVQFFIFKRTIKVPQNPFKKMIFAQIDDFLNDKHLEQIKVIRTFNSITLQLDKEEIDCMDIKTGTKQNVILENNDDDNGNLIADYTYETSPLVADCFSCGSCNAVESSENELEIHQFLRHSSFGIQLENECNKTYVNDEMSEAFWVCSFCSAHLENSNLLLLHHLTNHFSDLFIHINELLNIEKQTINIIAIESYINCIRECLQYQHTTINEDFRKIFFETYGEYENVSAISEKYMVEEMTETEQDIEMTEEIEDEESLEIKRVKSEKQTIELNLTDKQEIKFEIARSKCIVSTDTGEQRVIYRCQLVESCNHISNSASAIRYHLMKHIKNRDNLIEQRKSETSLDGYHYVVKSNNKNFCVQCNLKFKDLRALQLHEKCHQLFTTIAQHLNLPMCNTCNQKFINDNALNKHLLKHEQNEDLLQPIIVDTGTIRQQGKILGNATTSVGETNETEYSFKCGHCEDKYFTKEEHCNLHIMLFHTKNFICPIDKMEFSGFKSVSLFINHLCNKHNSELFPNLAFACTLCKTEFATIYDKLTHMKSCEMKQFECDHCGKRFFKKGDLIAHHKVYVSGEVQYQCAICNKKCLSSSDLKIHFRSHTKIKPYKCGQCSKSFRTLAARAAHVEGHNTQSLFICDVCNKNFKQRQLYRRHMKLVHETKSS